ncbi:MAG: secretin N-terminal domain-containing protein [Candidatus Krumholzibacteriia bacterium]
MRMRAHGMRIAVFAGLWLLMSAAASGQTLREIEIRGVGDGARIVLDVDGAVSHKSFTLSGPDRIVVDLVGVENAVRVTTRSVPGGPVKRVRIAQFAKQPKPVTRVVADLRESAAHEVRRENGKLVLVVTPGDPIPEVTLPVDPELSRGDATDAPLEPVPEPFPEPSPEPAVSASASQLFPVPVIPVEKDSPETGQDEGPALATQVEANPEPEAATAPSEASVATPGVEESDAAEPALVEEASLAVPRFEEVLQEQPSLQPPTHVDSSVRQTSRRTAAGSKVSGVTLHDVDAALAAPRWKSAPLASGEDTSPDPPQPIPLRESRGRRVNLDVQGADIRTVLRTLSDYSGRNIVASREVQGEVTARLKETPWKDALESILKAHGFGYVEENGIIRVGNLQRIRNEELEEAAAERKREDLLPIETEVVRVEFADAKELKQSLAEILTQRGTIQVDARTNALIVSDIPYSVAKITNMARELDSRTQQVEIVSKLVDVSADDSQNLGIQWSAANIMAGNLLGGAGVTAPTSGAVGGLRIGSVQSWGQLDMMLDALARSKRAKIISNPNITTVNNREAKILVGAKIPLIVADEAGNAITQLTTVGIQMRVTPHVNSDRTITLDLHPEVSELSAQATVQGGVIINTSEADTRVVVDNGDTAIIGGLIRDVHSEVRTGIPVLQDIPGVGWMFRNTNKTSDKRELIIFVTPQLIDSEVSLGSNGSR